MCSRGSTLKGVCTSIVLMSAPHVLAADHHAAMLYIQRHLLAGDAEDNSGILYQQRRDR